MKNFVIIFAISCFTFSNGLKCVLRAGTDIENNHECPSGDNYCVYLIGTYKNVTDTLQTCSTEVTSQELPILNIKCSKNGEESLDNLAPGFKGKMVCCDKDLCNDQGGESNSATKSNGIGMIIVVSAFSYLFVK